MLPWLRIVQVVCRYLFVKGHCNLLYILSQTGTNEKIDEQLTLLLSNPLETNAQLMIAQIATILVSRCMAQNKFYPQSVLVKLLQTRALSYRWENTVTPPKHKVLPLSELTVHLVYGSLIYYKELIVILNFSFCFYFPLGPRYSWQRRCQTHFCQKMLKMSVERLSYIPHCWTGEFSD